MNTVTNVPENAVCGLDGNPILLDAERGRADVIEWVNEYLGRRLDYSGGTGNATPIYLSDRGKGPLTTPERAVIEAFAWFSATYMKSLRRDTELIFPRIIHSVADESVIEEEQFTFADEARACMFAGVVENTFCANAEVIETPHGWVVAVTERVGPFEMRDIHQMEGACQLLCDYTVTPAAAASCNAGNEPKKQSSPEARRAWREHKDARAQRIEDKLDELLARLNGDAGPPAATQDATPGDRHSLSVKPRKKAKVGK